MNKEFLNRLVSFKGYVMTNKQMIDALIEDGYKPEIITVPKIKYNRRKYNRMDGTEQKEYEAKLKLTKTEYIAKNLEGSYYDITKKGYDYMKNKIA